MYIQCVHSNTYVTSTTKLIGQCVCVCVCACILVCVYVYSITLMSYHLLIQNSSEDELKNQLAKAYEDKNKSELTSKVNTYT